MIGFVKICIILSNQCYPSVVCIRLLHVIASDNNLLGTSFQKPARGPFGAKPAVASAFIGVSILMEADALAGIAKPVRASVSISIDTPMNAEALAGFVQKGP